MSEHVADCNEQKNAKGLHIRSSGLVSKVS